MSKKKNRKPKAELSEYILDNISDCTYQLRIDTIKQYLEIMDGSLLPEKYEWEIYNLFSEQPNLIKLIYYACEEDGYNSF